MQRRVADLKAAGLSPVLAAGGSGAGAGSVVATSAPRLEGLDQLDKGISGALATKQLELANQTIDKTAEEKALIKKQQLKTDADAVAAAASARKADADTAYTAQKTYQQLMDNKIQEATGLPSNPSTPAKVLDLLGLVYICLTSPKNKMSDLILLVRVLMFLTPLRGVIKSTRGIVMYYKSLSSVVVVIRLFAVVSRRYVVANG